jgi:transcription termination/antitermination protein NusG
MEGSLIRWYAVQVGAGRERELAREIQEKIHNHGFAQDLHEVFVPTEKVFKVQRGVRVQKDVCLYPGYVFLRMNYKPDLVSLAQSIPGVVSFVDGALGATGFLTDEEIEGIRKKVCSVEEKSCEDLPQFQVGEEVRVVSGCFSNMKGMIQSIGKERLNIEIVIFDKATYLELPFTSVERVG